MATNSQSYILRSNYNLYSFQSDSTETSISNDILMEDWIEKKSRYLGAWRLRWAVLKRHKFSFVLCTYKENYNKPTYSSYKNMNKIECTQNSIQPTEVMTVDYNTIITTHDGKFNEYIVDRFNIYFNKASTERCQLKIHTKSTYKSTDWINAISKAKLLSQESLYRMIPYYILAYCCRKFLNKNTFPFEITQIIIKYMKQDYNLNDIHFTIWKWNRYDSLFNSQQINISNHKTYYFLRNEAISIGNDEALVDHSVFTIGNKYKTESIIMNNPFDLKLDFNYNYINHHYHETKIIYHSLPNMLSNNNGGINSELYLPSLTYYNNHLFLIGGCSNNNNGYYINNSIYFMDFNDLEWEWIEIKTNKIPQAKYGCSILFIENGKKLIIVGGWNKITKSQNNICKGVLLITLDNNYDGFDIMELNNTQRKHTFGGIVNNLGWSKNKICIGSERYLEIYDCNKDLWYLYSWKTKVNHQRPQLWLDNYDKNVLYIAGNGADRIEWIDIRQSTKWKCFKYNHCANHANFQNKGNFNNYTPTVVVI